MAQFIVRDLEDDVKARLKRRALHHGRSMEEEIRHILTHGGIQDSFCAIISAEDVRFGKPHPEPFVRAYEKLKEKDTSLKASDCVAIEDSIGGIQSAHEAGMRCLAIAHSYGPERLQTASPEWIIDSIADFVPWLEKEVSK